MSASAPSDAVRAFVREHIQSVEQVEALLLLYRTSPREWSAVRVSRELRTDPVSAARRLADLHAGKLISARAEEDTIQYWYEGAQDRLVAEVERWYRERRTSFITELYSRPDDTTRAFADAFRLRGPKP
jgi:hypothetical protein